MSTSSCRLTSTPRSSRNSTMSVYPAEQAQWSAVLWSWRRTHSVHMVRVVICVVTSSRWSALLPGPFYRRASYRTGCSVSACQTAPCRRSYTPPRLIRTPPFLNKLKNKEEDRCQRLLFRFSFELEREWLRKLLSLLPGFPLQVKIPYFLLLLWIKKTRLPSAVCY